MEYVVALIGLLFGGVMFFKSKAEKAEVNAKLAEIKGRDEELKKQQDDLGELIDIIDVGLKEAEVKKEETKKKRKHMTLIERRELSNKRFGKKK